MAMIAWVALGGAVGAAARHGTSGWIHTWAGSALPWGTFAVNAAGSFLPGVVEVVETEERIQEILPDLDPDRDG